MDFDPKTFSWGVLLLVIPGALMLLWLFALRRRRPGLLRAGVGTGCVRYQSTIAALVAEIASGQRISLAPRKVR